MNLDQRLQAVNTSKPQLIHTPSKHSITASDDYYSLDSDQSNDEVARQYQTPPSHMRSPQPSREVLRSETTNPTIRPISEESQATLPKRPQEVHLGSTHAVKRKPVSGEGIVGQRAENAPLSPSTPGVDDTPYIRFAIDQLTRDEELLGPRRSENINQSSYRAYPAERITPAAAPAFNGQDSRSSRHDRHSSDTVIRHPSQPSSDSAFIPVEPAPSFRYPELAFVPGPLRILPLTALILCCLLIIVGLILCNVWSLKHNGLWLYDGVVTSRYFLFQFLPQILASMIIIWLLHLQVAMHRIFPFTALASGWSPSSSNILHNVALYPSTFLIPNLAYFKHAEPLLGVCSIIFWLALFTIPLISCLFQTRYYILDAQNVWKWTSVQPVGWILFAIYSLVVVALVLLLVRFSGRLTGLKWEVASLADIMVLLQRSNILSDFEGQAEERRSKDYRLGYWRTSHPPNELFHCIGEAKAKTHRHSSEQGIGQGTHLEEKHRNAPTVDLEAQRLQSNSSCEPNFEAGHERYRFIPRFLKESHIVAYWATALVLLIAFIIVSFVHHAVSHGFLPLLPAPTTTYGFSPADFLYSFLPSLLGMLLFLLFQPFDLTFRALEPYAHLASFEGTTAEKSLLLDYVATPPVLITIKALLAGHIKVGILSFLALISITLPILAGGVFTAQFFAETNSVRIAAHMPAYDALVFFLVLYALSFLFIWPGRKRHLPHDFRTLGQVVDFLYRSDLLRDPAFRAPVSRTDLVTRLISSEKRIVFGARPVGERREWMGIDWLGVGAEGEKKRPRGERRGDLLH